MQGATLRMTRKFAVFDFDCANLPGFYFVEHKGRLAGENMGSSNEQQKKKEAQ